MLSPVRADGTRSLCAPLQMIMAACDNSIRTVMILFQLEKEKGKKMSGTLKSLEKLSGVRPGLTAWERCAPSQLFVRRACLFLFLKLLSAQSAARGENQEAGVVSSFQHKNKTFYSVQLGIFSVTKHSTPPSLPSVIIQADVSEMCRT